VLLGWLGDAGGVDPELVGELVEELVVPAGVVDPGLADGLVEPQADSISGRAISGMSDLNARCTGAPSVRIERPIGRVIGPSV
jgi:hypothetical protein